MDLPPLLLVLSIILLVLCLILYPFSRPSRDGDKKEKNRGVVGHDRRTGNYPPSPVPQESLTRHAEASYAEPGGTDDGAVKLREHLIGGMIRTFSGEEGPDSTAMPLLRIDEVSDEVRTAVLSHIASLKNVDAIYRLQRVMGDPKTTMAELSLMITSNPLLSAKILQVANSPYYGMAQKLNSISHAIMIIGMVNLKAIIGHEAVLQVLNEKDLNHNPAMRTVWQHANFTSIYASYLHYLYGSLNMGNLFTLGLIHDIGKFIMMKLSPLHPCGESLPREYSPTLTVLEEQERYGINHALAGQLALRHWGLSPLIVDTVALHHAPVYFTPADLGIDHEGLQYLLVMFLADQAARLYAGRGDGEVRCDRLHFAYHPLIDRDKLSRLVSDKSLLAQLREAEAINGAYT